MPIERAVFHSSAWQVFWTAPGSTPPPPPPNGPPVASFTSTTSGTTVSFDGSASHGTGGVAITSYLWDFGDGKKSSASPSPTVSHTYATSGTFTVNLTVTAADKQTASASASVKITIVNKPPIAAFSTSVSGLTVTFNASTSSDSDGQIVSYAWNFGDGATTSGVTASHAYTSGGTKNVSLTVTDNLGGTGVASKSVVLSTLPVADFTFSVSGNTLSVDASPTVDANPISSYSWNWDESTTVPTYSFDTANDKHIITLHPISGSVLQSAVKSPDTGNVYSMQAGNGSNGTDTPYQSTYLSRMDSTGALIDWVKLIDAGHGTSFALEYTGGKTYIWMTWDAPRVTGGTTGDIVRFPYPVGANKNFTRSSPPSGMTVPYPGGLNNGHKTDVQFDVGKNRVVIRNTGPSGYNTFKQGVLSDFLAGKLTIYNTIVLPVGPPTLQGYFTYDYSLFVYWGVGYTVPSGGPLTSPTDPPRLREYRWIDGKEIASYDPSWWGQPYAGNHYEPESSTLYHPAGGAPYAWAGFITGTTGVYKYDLLQVPLIAGSQSIPDPPGSGKTAAHNYASTGTYNVVLTVKDTVGQTDTQTKGVTIGGVVNQPPVASFVSSATNLTASLNGSGSTDKDGTIASYAWTFGDGATGGGQTTSHTYSTGGTYTVGLTVTDNAGAKGSVSHAVSVSAPSNPGLGDGGGDGVTPSGAGITSYSSLSGSDFSTRCNAAGSNKVGLPQGNYTFRDFSISGSGGSMAQQSFWFGAKITAGGLLGPGSKYMTISMVPYTSTKASTVPTAPGTSNNLNYIFLTAAGAKVDGVKVVGTEQGHLYSGGLRFEHVSNPVLTNSTIAHIPGDSGSPPGETTGVDFQGCTGVVTVTNVTGDGGGVTAAMFESNNADCTYNITNLYTHDHPYSAGWASWEHRGTMNFYNYVMRKGARAFNAERIAGVVNFYDPLWDQAMSGHYDLNPTYDSSWVGGTINFYFSSTSDWNNFVAPRSTKKITAITNPSSVTLGLNKATVIKVYIGGKLQTQSDYVLWH